MKKLGNYRTATVSELREGLKDVLERPETTIIFRHSKPLKVLVDYDLFEKFFADYKGTEEAKSNTRLVTDLERLSTALEKTIQHLKS